MIILRQKQFGWFGFGKKKQPEQKAPEYKCPSISDLPTNLQQSLRGVERVWKKPETQKLLKELQDIFHMDFIPFTPYVEPKMVESAFKNILSWSLASEGFPESTLMYPVMWDLEGDWLLCYEITTNHFWMIDDNDHNFYDDTEQFKNLREFIADEINWFLRNFDPNFGYKLSKEEFEDLFKKIKKAFWI